ncbi:MAG: hypothetical protein U0232_10400 [Thermomicrobiales bacterium]
MGTAARLRRLDQADGHASRRIARLEHLFDHATPEATAAFRITPPPDRTFCLHAAMFVGTKD